MYGFILKTAMHLVENNNHIDGVPVSGSPVMSGLTRKGPMLHEWKQTHSFHSLEAKKMTLYEMYER